MGAVRWLSALPAFLALLPFLAWMAGTAEAAGSVGCGRPPPWSVPDHVVLEGRERRLIADLPADYDSRRPHRLVVAFHGRTNDNARVRDYYGLEKPAGGDPTIFVYPLALRQADGTFSWSDPGDSSGSLRDYALFDTIVARFARDYCIDPDGIFVVGHSLGASFVNSLACARGDLIRGIGSVAGGVQRSHCRGSVAALVLHNPADKLVPFSEGERARDALVAQNGQDEATAEPAEVGGFECERFANHDPANPVLWCPHHQNQTSRGRYYPHQWPSGTGEAIMDFFATLR
jgi:polyhydroxybutyrate depolymerase